MNELNDAELLERFVQDESDEAFAALVHRHVHLVHSAALRAVPSADQAEEITQAVFIILAHKASSLGSQTVLSGWLYRTARLTAANFRRTELRRTLREQEAFMRSTLDQPSADGVWQELSPLLDDAMTSLGKADHDALVLRYFENKSLGEVGTALGVGERAAQKRVERALDRLRRVFQKRGVKATALVIAGAISTHSVQAAPAGLAQTISTAAAGGSAVAASTLTLAKGTLSIMSWIKTKTALALGAAALAAVAGGTAAVHYHLKQAAWQQREQVEYSEARGRETARHSTSAGGYGGGIEAGNGNSVGSGNGESGSSAIVADDAEMQAKRRAERAERASGRVNLAPGPDSDKAAAELEAQAKAQRRTAPQP